MTWQDAVGRYCEDVMPGAIKGTTATRYLVSFRAVRPHLDGKFLDQLTRRDMAAMIGARKKTGVKNASVRRDLTAVSRVFASAIGWGVCEHNPALEYDRDMIRERRDPIDLPTPEEVARAIERAEAYKRIIAVASQTGMRMGEIMTLTWRQVEINRGVITLDRTKTDRPRAIPLTGPLLEQAAGTLSGTPRHAVCPLVFWHGDGEGYNNFSSNFTDWRRRRKVRFRFHDMRHYFAVMYLRGGGNIYALQRILGHASIKTTEIYLDYLTQEERIRAMHGTQSGT